METLRKNPKQQRSKELVSNIMEATTRVLKENGYVKASTQKIAEVAGVGIGSVYEYFKDKNSIIGNLLDQNMQRFVRNLNTKMDQLEGDTALELANSLVDLVFHECIDDEKLIRELYRQAAQWGKIDEILEHRQIIIDRIAVVLKEKEPQIEKPDVLAFVTVHAVMGVIFSYLYSKNVTLNPDEIKKEIKTLIRLRLENP